MLKPFIKRLMVLLLLLLAGGMALHINLSLLISVKHLLLVVTGSGALAFTACPGKPSKKEFVRLLGEQTLLVSFIIAFLDLFMYFSGAVDYENIRREAVLCMRPILYGLCIRLVAQSDSQPSLIPECPHEPGGSKEYLLNAGLTRRECEIAELLLKNMSNIEIAGELYLTENTVKKHNVNIYKKLEVSGREELKTKVQRLEPPA